jgi:hypothetical protein
MSYLNNEVIGIVIVVAVVVPLRSGGHWEPANCGLNSLALSPLGITGCLDPE